MTKEELRKLYIKSELIDDMTKLIGDLRTEVKMAQVGITVGDKYKRFIDVTTRDHIVCVLQDQILKYEGEIAAFGNNIDQQNDEA